MSPASAPAALTVSKDRSLLDSRSDVVEHAGAYPFKASSVAEAIRIIRKHPLCAVVLCHSLEIDEVVAISQELSEHQGISILKLALGESQPSVVYQFVQHACASK